MSYFKPTNACFDGRNNNKRNDIFFHSRRSPVFSQYGMVSSSQPLVSQIGRTILQKNGNAVDACVAMNAALAVIEPCSTGFGGDCFALFYSAADRKVFGLNGSGRTSSDCTFENYVNQLCITTKSDTPIKQYRCNAPIDIDSCHALNVTVPGNVCGMLDMLQRYGTMSREQVLKPAIDLAEKGFIIGPITAYLWNKQVPKLMRANHIYKNHYELSMAQNTCKAPQVGDIMMNAYIANTLRKLSVHGKSEFYNGSIADCIVDSVQKYGGLLTKHDLRQHKSTFVEPIKINYKQNVDIWEIPPNGQGLAALLALNLYEQKQDKLYNITRNMSDLNAYIQDLHIKTECMRLSYRYAQNVICDLEYKSNKNIQIEPYLSKTFAVKAAKEELSLTDVNRKSLQYGIPLASCDTVSFGAVDVHGNGCSFISSNYEGFGTGIIPKGCGFTLQNRGYNFAKIRAHPNAIGPNKRVYHTIIPGLATKNGDLYCVFSVMGGFMQPQGHFQVVSNMIDKGMNVQQALDAPRFCVHIDEVKQKISHEKKTVLLIEDQPNVHKIVMELKNKYKHDRIQIVRGQNRSVFGRGQIIYKDQSNGVLWGGSDGRADGCAVGLEMSSKL